MKNTDDMSFDEFDEYINPKPDECDFDRVVDRAMSRRDLLKGVCLLYTSDAADE